MEAQPFNDNPCQAITLIPGGNCVYQTFDNTGATLVHSPYGHPGCGGYNAGQARDVWFVLEVPANGMIQIDQDEGTLNNTAMAAYTAPNCSGPFTLVECDGSDSDNGIMPYLNLSGLSPGSYLYLRVWDFWRAPDIFGNGANPTEEGTFQICAETVGSLFEAGGNTSTTSYDCGSTPAAGNTCLTATPICAFDGYCGSTSGYSANSWGNLFNGLDGIFCGSIENNSFVSFVAAETSVELDVIVGGGSCDVGVQFIMFGEPSGGEACGSFSIVSYGCLGGNVSDPEMPPGTNNFTADGLTPGQQYYLMVDGNGGDICDYQINTISGVLVGMSAGRDRTICIGETVDLSVYNVGTGAITWTGPGLNQTIGQMVTATPTTVGPHEYIVTAPTTCTGQVSSDTVLVTVINSTAISLNAGTCNNGDVVLTASGASYYVWEPPLTINQTSGPVVTVTPAATTVYTAYGATNVGCVSAASVSVNSCLAPCVPPVFTVNDPPAVCAPSTVSLTSAVSGTGGNMVTYHSSLADANSGNNDLTVLSVSTSGNFYVRVEDPSDPSCFSVEAINVTINPSPIVNAGSDAAVCSGTGTTLTATGASTYTWSPSTGLSGTTGSTVTATPSASTTYTVIGTANGCSSTDQVTVIVNPIPSVNAGSDAAVCSGDGTTLTASGASSYTWSPSTGLSGTTGSSVTATPSSTTTYTVTGTTNGCSSIDQVTVTVNTNYVVNGPDVTGCDSVQVHGNWYSNSQIVVDVLSAQSTGCDSTVNTMVTISSEIYVIQPLVENCDSAFVGGQWYSQSTTIYDTTALPSGCDSINETSIIINQSYSVNGPDATGCDSVQVNGNWYISSQSVVDVLSVQSTGCDSTVTTMVTISSEIYVIQPIVEDCDSVFYAGHWYSQSTTVYDTTALPSGCDSINETSILINQSYAVNGPDVTGCDSVQLHGNWYNTSQTVVDVLSAQSTGCDSTVTTSVTVGSEIYIVQPIVEACDSAFLSGQWYSQSTTVYDTTALPSGCDSINETSIIINQSYVVNGPDVIGCDSVQVNGSWYTISQTVVDVLSAHSTGCDSTVTTLATVGSEIYIVQPIVEACDSAFLSGQWYSQSTTVFDTTALPSGCDSINETSIIINQSYSVNGPDVTGCDSVQVNGNWYNISQTVVDVLSTQSTGCDSTVTTQVIIGDEILVVQPFVEACDSAFYGGYWITSSTVVYDTTALPTGCDSINETSITINQSFNINGPDAIGCDSVQVNGNWYNTSQTLVNMLSVQSTGCDSTVTTQVIIGNETLVVQPLVEACDSAFYSGDWFASSTVVYDTTTLPTGCDSINETSIIIHQSYAVNGPAVTGCDSVQVHGNWYSSSQTVVDELSTQSTGCDSVITTVVTIVASVVVDAGLDVSICSGSDTLLTATGASDYSWSPSTGLNTTTGSAVLASPAVTTTYTVTGISGGCTDSDQITITVHTIPAMSAGTDQEVCQGESVTLSGSGADVYIWDNGVTDGVPFIPVMTQQYGMTGIDSNGCQRTNYVTVVVNDSTQIALLDNTCEGSSYQWPDGSSGIVDLADDGQYTFNFSSTATGCDSTINLDLTILPVSAVIELDSICVGESYTLPDGQITDVPGTYTFATSSLNGCDSIVTTILNVNAVTPETDPLSDPVFCLEEGNAILDVSYYNGEDFHWNTGDLGPVITAGGTGTYIVTVTQANGCNYDDTIQVVFEYCEDQCNVLAPTAFTPDGDRENDVFYVLKDCVEPFNFFEFRVYNRWGEEVFQTNDPGIGWDGIFNGVESPLDVYTYYCSYRIEGQDKGGHVTGVVTLIR